MGSRFARYSAQLNLPPMKAGEVWIVGAGPGEAGLLTLYGLHGLQEADVVLHDSLISPAVLALAQGELIYVGKRKGALGANEARKQKDISAQMIARAQENKKVLRLKGGDPSIFGRGGEEASALMAAGVPFKMFAGVSAALAAAHRAEVALTHREHNRVVAFVTGHEPEKIDWQSLFKGAGVVAIYMPQDYKSIQRSLLAAGKKESEALILVSAAGLAEGEKITHTTLGALEQVAPAPPAILLLGAKKWSEGEK